MSPAKNAPMLPIAINATPRIAIAAAPSFLRPRECRIERSSTSPIDTRQTMPASTPMSRVLSRMSPWNTWLNSCATTPCSSSRSSCSNAPRVTATAASRAFQPAANALMPASSSSTNMRGTGVPDAIAISSTTFTNRRSSVSRVPGSTSRPPSICATAAPPCRNCAMRTSEPIAMTASVSEAAPATISNVDTRDDDKTATATALTPATMHATEIANRTTRRRVARFVASWCAKKSIVRGALIPSTPARTAPRRSPSWRTLRRRAG